MPFDPHSGIVAESCLGNGKVGQMIGADRPAANRATFLRIGAAASLVRTPHSPHTPLGVAGDPRGPRPRYPAMLLRDFAGIVGIAGRDRRVCFGLPVGQPSCRLRSTRDPSSCLILCQGGIPSLRQRQRNLHSTGGRARLCHPFRMLGHRDAARWPQRSPAQHISRTNASMD